MTWQQEQEGEHYRAILAREFFAGKVHLASFAG
jgi:hypothetical protein